MCHRRQKRSPNPSQCILVRDLKVVAAVEAVAGAEAVASCFASPEVESGVQPGGGETPAPHASVLPWRSSFQNVCTTSFGQNGCGKNAETHT